MLKITSLICGYLTSFAKTTMTCSFVLTCLTQQVLSEDLAAELPRGSQVKWKLPRQQAILGGGFARQGEFPYQVHVQAGMIGPDGNPVKGTVINCGGTIIWPNWILTAAHCVYYQGEIEEYKGKSFDAMVVGVGHIDLDKVKIIRVVKSFPHESYNTSNWKSPHDIALLKLPPRSGAHHWIGTLAAADEKSLARDNTRAVVIGWGATFPTKLLKLASERLGGTEIYSPFVWESIVGSQKLKKTKVPIVNHERCKIIGDSVVDTNICAGGEPSVGACYGDSGGPLLVRANNKNGYVQVGVVSRAAAEAAWCGLGEVPGIFTRVSSYNDWMAEVIRANSD